MDQGNRNLRTNQLIGKGGDWIGDDETERDHMVARMRTLLQGGGAVKIVQPNQDKGTIDLDSGLERRINE